MIGSEFYGGKRPFSSLTTLKFEEMLAWKDWSPYDGGPEEEVPFSHLEHLVVRRCPSLVGTLPCQLDRLTKLEIHSCPHLNNSTSVVRLPSLRKLYLVDCNKEILKSLVNITSLTVLKIENLDGLFCFDHEFVSCLVKLKELRMVGCDKLTYLLQDGNEMLNLTCLQELVIKRCHQFTSFVAGEGEMELPRNLERMELSNCESLEKLPTKMHLLRNLRIRNCPKIMGVNILRDGPSGNNLMPQLESLGIYGCGSLVSFSFAEGRLAALKTLCIMECKGVESLEEFIVAESLESLTIESCKNVRSLPQRLAMLSHLTSLEITDCAALEIEDFPPLPITLSSLMLRDCPEIKSIASCNIASCKNLTQLSILDCPALEIEDFPLLPITLSSFSLSNCPKIKALPNQWHHLTSLQSIYIHNCPNIECFAKGRFPPNLRILSISGRENVKQPVREWGLTLLTSLQYLIIDFGGEGEKVWFPSKDEDAWSLLFPSSLISLWIKNMRKVERLPSGLRNHLSSLQYLYISDCPKLSDLPEDGLPPSLQYLWIEGCSNLKEGCSKHIPAIYINRVRIR